MRDDERTSRAMSASAATRTGARFVAASRPRLPRPAEAARCPRARRRRAPSPAASRVRSRSTACSVGSRFAACCQTAERGPSITPAATSSPRCAGRQCRKTGVRRGPTQELLGRRGTARAVAGGRRARLPRPSTSRRRCSGIRAGHGGGSHGRQLDDPSLAGDSGSIRSGSRTRAGTRTTTSSPASAPASMSECATLLLPSPTKATPPTGERPVELTQRQQVGKRLAWMVLVGQRVDHGHGRGIGELLDRPLRERPDRDRLHVAREHAGRVGDRLAAAELELVGPQRERQRAEPVRSRLEGHACPCRRLLEEARERLAREARRRSAWAVLHAAASSSSASNCCGRRSEIRLK